MIIRYATNDEIATWDDLLLHNPDSGNAFASREMAETKADNGWKPRYIVADDMYVLALEKYIPLLGKFWYLPKGPGVKTVEQLQQIIEPLKTFAMAHGVFVVKIEPEILKTSESTAELSKMGLEPTFAVQPNASTIMVDLTPSNEDILASFSQSTRRMIRQAEKDSVTVRSVEPTSENCTLMYAIYKETAAGQFSLRAYEYYENYWQKCAENHVGKLFLAYVNDTLVAGVYVLTIGKNAIYKDGASPRTKIARGVGQYIQWRVIEELKLLGITKYDLHGSPSASRIDDKSHPKYRLGIFKTGFNKTVTDYVGGYNLPVKHMSYKIWIMFGERVILRLHRLQSHSEWY